LIDQAQWAAEQTYEELRALAHSELPDIFTPAGQLKTPDQWPIAARKYVSSIKVTERHDKDGNPTVTREIKLWDKLKALDMLHRRFGLYAAERVQVTAGSLAAELREADERLERLVPDVKVSEIESDVEDAEYTEEQPEISESANEGISE